MRFHHDAAAAVVLSGRNEIEGEAEEEEKEKERNGRYILVRSVVRIGSPYGGQRYTSITRNRP